MPNSASRNPGNNNAGKGSPKHDEEHDRSQKSNPERSELKNGEHPKNGKGDTSRSSSQGRKTASGGSAED